jgi:hypothetical protein
LELLKKYYESYQIKGNLKGMDNSTSEKRNAYRVLVGKPERKIPLGRIRCTWQNNIEVGLTEIGWV